MSSSLASVHPELISEWSEKNLPLTPDKITFGSNKRVWWKGACGHEWETSVKARSKGEKCPICSGARVIEGINDLATLKPLLAQEWSEKNKLPLVLQTFLIFSIAYGVCWLLKLPHRIAAPAGMIGASNFFELAVAVAVALFGTTSPAALATTVGVLTEVPVMLFLVKIANKTKGRFPA